MVNLDKWEEIEYDDIKEGDTIRCITVQGSVVSDTRGVAYIHVFNGWQADNVVRFVSNPENFNPIEGGYRLIYRRKPKAPKIKERLGAVLLVEGRASSHKVKDHFVFDGATWSSATECAHLEDLKEDYTKLTVLQEGIEID